MDLQVDLRIAELLSSRLCHDLVSPIGAVNNGMELMEEDPDPETMGDAVRLISGSARQALAVVQFYRLAYGRAGNRVDADPEQLRQLAEGFLVPHKSTLVWRAEDLGAAPDGSGKLLLNMIALGLEALPRGGELTAEVTAGDRPRVGVTAAGRDAGLRPESRAALSDDVDVEELTPRSVQGHFTWLLARRMGGTLDSDVPEEGRVAMSVPIGTAGGLPLS
jgi:histidine phosphotransferase ChpT